MGDIYSDFLDELLSNIRTRSISWDAQQRSGLIDDSQVRTIKTIDKQRRENRADIVSKVQPASPYYQLGILTLCRIQINMRC